MKIFNGVILIQGVPFVMFASFICIFIGLLLGRIKIKGVSLGSAGVFIIALLFGAIFSDHISDTVSQKHKDEKVDISANALKIIENIGLIFFIGSVGFISGPTFFGDLKKNFKSYLLSGLVIILVATLTCVACFYIGKKSADDVEEFNAMIVGIYSGALTSTPAFSAAKATADSKYESAVTVGHGIAYLFGVIGVVLYVQLVPKILGANMEVEKYLISGEEYIKRVGTERTDISSLHKTRSETGRESSKEIKEIKVKKKEKDNNKNKKDELNINNDNDVEKKIEYDPKRIPTERIETTSRQKKLISTTESVHTEEHEKEHEQENEQENEQEHEQDNDQEHDHEQDHEHDQEHNKENENNHEQENENKLEKNKAWLELDKYGLCVYSFGAVAGIFIGAIRIPLSKDLLDGTTFSFTTTGGVLITTLVLGHYGSICCLSLKINKKILELFRELGLILFLLGTGISGGAKFVDYFKAVYFLYGIAMTIFPLIFGFLFGKFVLKLSLLNNLGSLCGGMTSTPALGTLIAISGTDEIGNSYAATYPISLISVVLASQFMVILMK